MQTSWMSAEAVRPPGAVGSDPPCRWDAGKPLQQDDPLRDHVLRQAFPTEPLQLVLVKGRRSDAEGEDPASKQLIRNRHGGGLLNVDLRIEGRLDLAELDAVATALDHVVASADEPEHPPLWPIGPLHDITGPVGVGGGEPLGGPGRVAPVSLGDDGAPDDELALDPSCRDDVAGLVLH
jgi:hypothetical protein